eukprot:gnl/Spiro4/8823_TR4642_c0_g1_i1.p1 gnl/Spiro4/8823_TR4642_c0_g1~~gnl/Spiro4/8823_TR4642_c0_g1_i1.p1  ORF type:complete len:451 (+),score=93.57 gnl/Spiro4/8823_TR4642_c0_g1_i1:29-1381(+)
MLLRFSQCATTVFLLSLCILGTTRRILKPSAKLKGDTCYEILDLEHDATDRQIKKAYIKLAGMLHPDKNPGDSAAQEKFVKVANAYELLADAAKREKYDLRLTRFPNLACDQSETSESGFGSGPARWRSDSARDIFDELFRSQFAWSTAANTADLLGTDLHDPPASSFMIVCVTFLLEAVATIGAMVASRSLLRAPTAVECAPSSEHRPARDRDRGDTDAEFSERAVVADITPVSSRVAAAHQQSGGQGEISPPPKTINKSQEWTFEEMALLSKALAKYKPGTANRMSLIAQAIGSRTEQQVMKKLHSARATPASAAAERVQADSFLQFIKNTKSSSEWHGDQPLVSDDASIAPAPAPALAPAPASGASVVPSSSPLPRPQAPKPDGEAGSGPWLPAEQRALESGLRAFPPSAPDRWTQISQAVGTRTAVQCQARCKELRAIFAAQHKKS